jgi:hypothetical protein
MQLKEKKKKIRGGCRRNRGEENRREGMKRGKELKKKVLE